MRSYRRSSSKKVVSHHLVILHLIPSSIEGYIPSKVVFHQRQFYLNLEGSLPSKVVFQERLSFVKCPLLLKVIFHQRSFSICFSPVGLKIRAIPDLVGWPEGKHLVIMQLKLLYSGIVRYANSTGCIKKNELLCCQAQAKPQLQLLPA